MELGALRIDKWLWAARFFKTRSLATEAIQRRQVEVNQTDVKPAKEIRVGDVLTIWQAGISGQRGSAPVAQQLYEETTESVQRRAQEAENRRLSPEPALTIEHGRPTKRDRRDLQKRWDAR